MADLWQYYIKKKNTCLGSKPALLLSYKNLGKLLSFPDALSICVMTRTSLPCGVIVKIKC